MIFPAAEVAFIDSRLSGRARRVYAVAIRDLDMRRFRTLKLSRLATLTGLHAADCSRARSRLVKLGYLERRKEDRRFHVYRLVHSVVGETANLKSA